jgi:steroid delta-isomerase-like uncharacterized protein
MSTENNKALARRWLEEVWNQDDLSLIDELIAPNYVLHDPSRPGLRGRTGIRESVAMFRTASPDLHFTIEDQIAEGDKVVTRYTIQGTHQGPLLGIAATGKQATLTGIDIYRIAESKIEEAWSNWDTLGMLQQLGAIPMPGQ